MSNAVCLEACEFVNPVTGNATKGYRIYDDYGQSYNNTLETVSHDDLEMLQQVLAEDIDEVTAGMLDYIRENLSGMNINDEYYEWEQIEDILNPADSIPNWKGIHEQVCVVVIGNVNVVDRLFLCDSNIEAETKFMELCSDLVPDWKNYANETVMDILMDGYIETETGSICITHPEPKYPCEN